MSQILWEPGVERISNARVTAFRLRVNERCGTQLENYDELYTWSLQEPVKFWEMMWGFGEIRSSRSWDKVLEDGDRMPGAHWFTGARLNFAENLLRWPGSGDPEADPEVIVFWSESGQRRRLTRSELHHQVARLAHALREAGVTQDDMVAGFMPNIPETVVAMLATASLGAVWTSCSPDFGVAGVLDRFGQTEPKILFTADGYHFNGKAFDSLSRVHSLLPSLPSIEKVIVVPFEADARADSPTLAGADLTPYAEFLGPESVTGIEFAQLPFDHPLYVMYSSGTTGLPKCMVHSAGGTLIQHLKEHALHCDIGPGDRVFYYTTCGWMMWNWLVSALASQATILLYDGSPVYPQSILWDLATQERMTVFGTSAKYLAALEKKGTSPRQSHDLSALKSILSTGSPLAPESFDYVYREIKPDLQLSSISGGTDIISCFALGSPVLPVHRGELQCRGLGMQVEIYDAEGRPVVGQKGELVCSAPFPSMPICFWNDPDGARYHAAYFDHFPGIWAHGDYAELRPEGGVVIYGRSDAVLNPGGVRIGTAEIYRVVDQFDEVLESIAVGQEWRDDVRVVLFVHLRDGLVLDKDLADRISMAIRREETPRHVPAKIIQVAAIPRTISGKIVELAVREIIHGRPVKNVDALADPDVLKLYEDLPELKS